MGHRGPTGLASPKTPFFPLFPNVSERERRARGRLRVRGPISECRHEEIGEPFPRWRVRALGIRLTAWNENARTTESPWKRIRYLSFLSSFQEILFLFFIVSPLFSEIGGVSYRTNARFASFLFPPLLEKIFPHFYCLFYPLIIFFFNAEGCGLVVVLKWLHSPPSLPLI